MQNIPLQVGVRGEIEWFAYDENDNRIPVKTADGRELWGGHVQKNLITNLGLDAMADPTQLGGWANPMTATSNLYTNAIKRRLHVGTGSVVPAFTDTALVAEAQTTDSTGGFTDFHAGHTTDLLGTPPGMDTFAETNHVVVMTADRNLTEYGYSNGNSAALTIRELFRDEFDVPITISLLTGTKLRVRHRWWTRLDFTRTTGTFSIQRYDVAGVLVGTDVLNAEWGLSAAVDDPGTFSYIQTLVVGQQLIAPSLLTGLANTGSGDNIYLFNAANPVLPASFYLTTGEMFSAPANGAPSYTRAHDSYVPGSRERICRWILGEAVGNQTLYGWRRMQGTAAFGRQGYIFDVCFRDGLSFAKLDTHTITFGVKVSWDRV